MKSKPATDPIQDQIDALYRRHCAAPVDDKLLREGDFPNGGCYIQHCAEALAGLREAGLLLFHQACPGFACYVDSWVAEGKVDRIDDPKLIGFAGRYFSEDNTHEGLRSLANRLYCGIDFENSTEWGQGYFTIGAGKGSAEAQKSTCLNPGQARAMWEAQTLRESVGKGQGAPCEASAGGSLRI